MLNMGMYPSANLRFYFKIFHMKYQVFKLHTYVIVSIKDL